MGHLGSRQRLLLFGLSYQRFHGSAGGGRQFKSDLRPKPAATMIDHAESHHGSATGNCQHGRISASVPRGGNVEATAHRLPGNRRGSLEYPRPSEPGGAATIRTEDSPRTRTRSQPAEDQHAVRLWAAFLISDAGANPQGSARRELRSASGHTA